MKSIFILCIILILVGSKVNAASTYDSVFVAAMNGNAEKVKMLLELDAGGLKRQLNNTNTGQEELLRIAVKSGSTATVKVLLDYGIDINSFTLSTSGKVYTSHNLLESAIPLVDDNYGVKSVSVTNKNVSERAAVKAKVKKNSAISNDSAADKGIKMINFLIDNGLDITKYSNVVNVAADYGKLGLIPFFHKKGISIKEKVPESGSCNANLLHFILKKARYRKNTPILKETVEYIVNIAPEFINEKENECSRGTSLLAAYETSDKDIVKYLVSKGAKNIKDRRGVSPVEYAVQHDKTEMFNILKTADK